MREREGRAALMLMKMHLFGTLQNSELEWEVSFVKIPGAWKD
jgi:hypothetical protein